MTFVEPLVTEVRIDQFNDREWRYAWHNAKLRWAIAAQVRAIRLSKGWSQQVLAYKADTNQSTISHIENATAHFPAISTILKIAWAFDCAFICQFVGWSEWLRYMAELEKQLGEGLTGGVLSFDEELEQGCVSAPSTSSTAREGT